MFFERVEFIYVKGVKFAWYQVFVYIKSIEFCLGQKPTFVFA